MGRRVGDWVEFMPPGRATAAAMVTASEKGVKAPVRILHLFESMLGKPVRVKASQESQAFVIEPCEEGLCEVRRTKGEYNPIHIHPPAVGSWLLGHFGCEPDEVASFVVSRPDAGAGLLLRFAGSAPVKKRGKRGQVNGD